MTCLVPVTLLMGKRHCPGEWVASKTVSKSAALPIFQTHPSSPCQSHNNRTMPNYRN